MVCGLIYLWIYSVVWLRLFCSLLIVYFRWFVFVTYMFGFIFTCGLLTLIGGCLIVIGFFTYFLFLKITIRGTWVCMLVFERCFVMFECLCFGDFVTCVLLVPDH